MTLRRRSAIRRLGAGAAAVAALALVLPPQAGHAAIQPAHAAATQAANANAYMVTLITGDRVRVHPRANGTYAVQVTHGAGRQGMAFMTRPTKTGLAVIPADAISLIAANKLDARLFDVVLLKKLGYDDAHTTELPLLTSSARGAGLAPSALAGSKTLRSFPRLGVSSVRAAKKQTGTFWKSLTTGSKGFAPSMGKVSLVGKLYPTLDESAAQVGAPEAWQAGFTGKGTTVAVVDTGVDSEHPDLKGVVTDAVDFTHSENGTKDEIGHGTHVAGTIAGRGVASDGKYTGIAKGAEIKSAKVCGEMGCPEDAILAGMEWAAQSGAKVINMSLGGPPSETGDFLEQAVDMLTQDFGVLFVIAAGNEGAPETIGSPGTADAALTVGSVDKKTDELSFFSSQGPRVVPSRRMDYAIKPDITAPGHEIIAPRAEGTLEEEKVGEHYAQLSGTSMATPHVAGAAAIVAGQHPEWTPAQLKSALTSTAKFNKKYTVYQQGAGRVDVGKATRQTITSTGVLNLGYYPWPHTSAVPSKQTVTYTNSGTSAVTLALKLEMKDDKGAAAAANMFAVSAQKVTVPAGKTASVTVTVKPKIGKVGLYGGVLTATAADGKNSVQTAVGTYKEPESYNVSVLQLNQRGGKGATDIFYINRDTGAMFGEFSTGTSIKRLPAGKYTVMTGSYLPPADGSYIYDATLEARDVVLKSPADLVFDARKGKPLKVTLDRADAQITDLVGLDVAQRAGDDVPFAGTLGGRNGHLFTVGGKNLPGFQWGVNTTFVKKGTGGVEQPPTPWTYNLAIPGTGNFPGGKAVAAKKAEMAAVTQSIARQHKDEYRSMGTAGFTSELGGYWSADLPLGDLTKRTDYFTTKPGTKFGSFFLSGDLSPEGYNTGDYYFGSVPRSYKAGEKSTQTWNRGVFGPAVAVDDESAPVRVENEMYVAMPLLSSADHLGGSGWQDTGSSSLALDGEVIAEGDYPGSIYATDLPAAKARYTVKMVSERAPAWADLSRRVEAEWAFDSSDAIAQERPNLPMSAVRFLPKLDADNQAPGGKAFTFPVRVDRTPGSGDASVTSLSVEVSYDGGKTWKAVSLTGTGASRVASVTNPASGTVSLRAKSADSAGNTVTQTIINAYLIAPH